MSFWRPGTIAPGSSISVENVKSKTEFDRGSVNEAEKDSEFLVYNPNASLSLQEQRVKLPIYQYQKTFQYLLSKFQVIVVVGETGSGKSTQLPQFIETILSPDKLVGISEPRRVAAISLAQRVAQEQNTSLGQKVGYTIRFQDKSSAQTRIKFMTDGILLREIMWDPLLSKYGVIMLDEAHERSLYTDLLLGVLKKILKKRTDLKLIVSSATLEAEEMKRFFQKNEKEEKVFILGVEGRTFPVDIHYRLSPVSDYVKNAIETVLDIHKFEPPGDILVFFTGQEEIDNFIQMLKDRASAKEYKGTMKIRILPLYSGLPHERQLTVFQPAPKGTRKIIASTNIAETSVTIDGIIYVVDPGFVKVRVYQPRLGIESLEVVPISQSQAKQRTGRAGRNRPGKCYRLYTEQDYNNLPKNLAPEIQRTNLATIVLQLKALGIDNILNFDFLSPPPLDNLLRALEILYSLKVLDDDAKLTTPVGTTIAEFPLDPYLAKVLISSGQEFGCSEEMLSIMSLLSVQTVYTFTADNRNQADQRRRRFAVTEGDHITLLNIFTGFIRSNRSGDWAHSQFLNYKALLRAEEIRNQLKQYLRKFKIPIVSCKGKVEQIQKCLISGYFANAARLLPNGTYKQVRGDQILQIHPISVLYNRNPEWVIFHEVVQTSQIFMREVTAIEPYWLAEIAPHFYNYQAKSMKSQQVETSVTTVEHQSGIVHRNLF